MQLAATLSVRRWSQVRYVSSEWLEVPSAEELIASSRETRAYFEQQASRCEGPVGPAEGAED